MISRFQIMHRSKLNVYENTWLKIQRMLINVIKHLHLLQKSAKINFEISNDNVITSEIFKMLQNA